ncbi:MAG: (Fe-S)-binding protein [Planctomycetes bacterium]|nr:(Fe-S)-binding protein [Planctomycetota bacterium]
MSAERPLAGDLAREPRPRVVQLFPTCLVNELVPEVGRAAVELLERAGVAVELPAGLACCGQPAWNAGFVAEAKAVARGTIERLAATQGPIVVPSGSCGDMLVHQMLELFRDEPRLAATARVVASRVVELTQFLAAVAGTFHLAAVPGSFRPAVSRGADAGVDGNSPAPGETGTSPPPGRTRVAYHPSCHLVRGLGVGGEPVELLRRVAGVELVPLEKSEECCGFGGLFSVKQPELSGAMLDAKCRALEASGADVVASCDSGCLLHLAGGLARRGSSIRTCHVAELLAAALPSAPPPLSQAPASPPAAAPPP